jgi:hypothetical protein
MTDEYEEGWYTDPYGRHEARWMSAGSPTKLVRDSDVESYDDPPDEEPSQEATKIVEEPPPGTDDLRRADDAETGRQPTSGEFVDAAVFGAVSSWHLRDHKPQKHG